MPDVLITDFFTKQTKSNTNSKKRSSSNVGQDEDPNWTPANATKRPKVSKRPRTGSPKRPPRLPDAEVTQLNHDHPMKTPGASSSKFKMLAANPELIVIPSGDLDVTGVGNTSDVPPKQDLFSQYRSPLPPSSAPSSSWRYGRRTLIREESIVPATPEHDSRRFTAAKGAASPIRLTFKTLSQTWSDETVGSSQSQEDDDLVGYGGASINLTRTIFGAPRSNWATKGSMEFRETSKWAGKGGALHSVSPQLISSSQSQSQYLSMSHASPQRLRGRATVLIDESLELIPSSQSQEKEMDMATVLSQRAGWHIRRSTTPEMPHPSPLKKASSLTKELHVRRLSLREGEDPGPLADDLDDPRFQSLSEGHLTPRRSRQETQEWDTPSQRQVASTLLEFGHTAVDQSCPMVSPSRSVRFGSSQAFSLSQPFAFTQPSQHFPLFPSSQVSPSTPPRAPAAADLREDSQTQESVPLAVREPEPVSPQSLPAEVKAFHAMFEGGVEDESYPPDFPMSLRF